jgi:hypothetical protein
MMRHSKHSSGSMSSHSTQLLVSAQPSTSVATADIMALKTRTVAVIAVAATAVTAAAVAATTVLATAVAAAAVTVMIYAADWTEDDD